METYDSYEFVKLSDEKQFKVMFERFYGVLCVFANRYVDNDALAADIVQEAFLKLWLQRAEFSFLHQVKAFLYVTVRNKALNEIEHLKVAGNYAVAFQKKNQEGYFSDQIIEIETHRVLCEAIDRLPTQSRNIMKLALAGYNNAEIAARLEVSRETVHTLKKGAYRKLRIALQDYYFFLFL